jgi:hypothetical protein
MKAFNNESFMRRLIGETLFYDEEYGALGNLSLIDADTRREKYVASFVPDLGQFLVEEATEWEEDTPDADDDIGYALAVDSKEVGLYDLPEEAAEVLLKLATEQNLMPSITLLFEEDEVI